MHQILGTGVLSFLGARLFDFDDVVKPDEFLEDSPDPVPARRTALDEVLDTGLPVVGLGQQEGMQPSGIPGQAGIFQGDSADGYKVTGFPDPEDGLVPDHHASQSSLSMSAAMASVRK